MDTTASAPGKSHPLAKRWFWIILIGLVSVVSVIKYFDTFSPDARAAHRFLRDMPAADIQEIAIEPYTVLSLTDHVIVIRDRNQISRIAAAFRGLESVSPNHPHARWVAIVRFQLADRQYGGQIETTTNNQSGLFWFASNVRGGWNYGAYRNDQLGPLFEQLIADEKIHPKP
jgi:hypothetical protein